jgi:hypothetical protein
MNLYEMKLQQLVELRKKLKTTKRKRGEEKRKTMLSAVNAWINKRSKGKRT